MFFKVKAAKGPLTLPTPAQEAQEALAQLRAHRLQTDKDMAQEIRAEQTKQSKVLRWNTIKLVSLGLGTIVPIIVMKHWVHFPMSLVKLVSVIGLLILIGAMTIGAATALFARNTQLRQRKDLAEALVALSQKDYENEQVVRFFKSSYRSMQPLTDETFVWSRTTNQVKEWPELAEIWTDWLLGDKPVRHRDVRDLTEVATKLEKARDWTAQVGSQEKEGEGFQVDLRTEALQYLPSDLVAARRERLLRAQLSSTSQTTTRPRF